MKACGHEHITVEGCDTCYIVVLKKRVARLLEKERMRLDRIAELEAYCEKAEYELDWHSDELRKLEKEEQLFHNTLDAQQMIIEELRAEDTRLRDAAQAVVDSATPHYDRWVNGVTRICINRLAALLGGGE